MTGEGCCPGMVIPLMAGTVDCTNGSWGGVNTPLGGGVQGVINGC